MRCPRILVPALGFSLLLTGCASSTPEPALSTSENRPDYGRQLAPGRSALRLITDPGRYPDLAGAYEARDVFVLEAIDHSLDWFDAPSSRRFFPFESITHDQAQASLLAFRETLQDAPTASVFVDEVTRQFDIYESVGWDGRGTVLFTGYYAPVFEASAYQTQEFNAPLYRRPDDLATDPVDGTPLGRRVANGAVVPYYTRAEIEASNMFDGDELVWLRNPLEAYIVQVNGSAKLRMTDGTSRYIGYAGKTDHPYTGLGQLMLDRNLVPREGLSLKAIQQLYDRDPELVESLILENDNYVFFTEYDGASWPAGSLGVPVTRETSLATDKRIYPRGGLVLVDTEAVTYSRGKRPFLRFMLDQDTGGAIQAPGRADIFMGIGKSAEILAGGQYAEGRLYYLLLKPHLVDVYRPRSDV